MAFLVAQFTLWMKKVQERDWSNFNLMSSKRILTFKIIMSSRTTQQTITAFAQ